MAKDSYEKAVELASHLESSSTVDVNWATIALGKCQLWFAMNHYREVMQFDNLFNVESIWSGCSIFCARNTCFHIDPRRNNLASFLFCPTGLSSFS